MAHVGAKPPPPPRFGHGGHEGAPAGALLDEAVEFQVPVGLHPRAGVAPELSGQRPDRGQGVAFGQLASGHRDPDAGGAPFMEGGGGPGIEGVEQGGTVRSA